MTWLTRQWLWQKMSAQIYVCSSTSTTDLYQRKVTNYDSYSQTITINHDDDDYANTEDASLQKSFVPSATSNIKKTDKSFVCRINCHSVGCWTKPACLSTN